jgi:23S rRNA (pseudouridine1915-N3)-methyltransferase
MKFVLARAQPRRRSSSPADTLVQLYAARVGAVNSCEIKDFASEGAFLAAAERNTGRTRPHLVLTDSTGQQFSSEALAGHVGKLMETGIQLVYFAVGPADGWSAAAKQRADLLLAFGRITLPHELAAVILAEQIYRATCILSGHPYHRDH